MELHELHVLQRQAGAQHHPAAVAGAGVGRCGGVIAAAIAAGRQHDRLRAEAVDLPVVEAHRHHADALLHPVPLGHDEVEREVLDEEVRVVLEALLVERVEHGVTGAVGRGAGALHRRAGAHVLHVPAEGPLVDRAVGIAAEGHARVLELIDRCRSLAREIFDRVLVAQPVRPLDGVVHVPGPVVGRIVAERGGNPALRRHGVRAGGEDLGDVRGAKARFRGAHRRAQARSARTDHDDVIGVVDDRVGTLQVGASHIVGGSVCCRRCHQALPPNASAATLKIPKAPPPMVARLSAASAPNLVPASWT